jgi:hypothetical protein
MVDALLAIIVGMQQGSASLSSYQTADNTISTAIGKLYT